MNHDETETDFAELDEQIRSALRLEIPADQLDRVGRYWRQQSRAENRRRNIRRVSALAAGILISLAAVWQLWRGPTGVDPARSLVTHTAPAGTQPDNDLEQSPAANGPSVEQEVSDFRGRPATPYEQLIFTLRLQKRENAKRIAAAGAIDDAIASLARNPDADARQLLQSADLESVDVESVLLRKLHRGDDQRKRAVMRLLALHGTSESTSALLKLARNAALRQQALETIEQAVGFESLAKAATQTDDSTVRAAICRHLFENASALDAYLSLVKSDSLRNEALTVADKISQTMLDQLLTRLHAEDAAERLAAALVLGRANGPAVTRSLIGVVSDNRACPAEAWIALMACRGPQADQFLAYATGHPRLLGPLNRARVYWARITY